MIMTKKTKLKLIACIILSIVTLPFLFPIWKIFGIIIGCFIDIVLFYLLFTYLGNKFGW